jgi:hypothetical protein
VGGGGGGLRFWCERRSWLVWDPGGGGGGQLLSAAAVVLGRWVVAAGGPGRCHGTCSGGRDPWSCWIRALRQDASGPGESSVRAATSSTGCSPSRPWQWCWSVAATVVGSGVIGLLLAAPWWCLGMCQTSLRGGIVDEVVVRSGFSGRKPPLSVAMVVAPLASLSLLRAPLRSTMSLQLGLPGRKPCPLRTCGDNAIGVVTFLEAPHLETHFSWWRSAGGVALCVAVAVVRLFRADREVQRAMEV